MKIPFLNIELFKSKSEPKAFHQYDYWTGRGFDSAMFDGEKTPYEMGNPLDFDLNYHSLRMRAWEAYLMSDVIQNAIRKYCLWIVGSGLKLQSNPIAHVLDKHKIDIDESKLKQFTEDSESQFRLYANTIQSVYSKQYTLHDEAAESLKNALLAGDILCILRFDGKRVSIETIDGKNIQTPILSDFQTKAEERGNKIIDGIEIDKQGNHVSYYIAQDDFEFDRVLAYGEKSGKLQAWLMYGLRYKKSSVRGMSLLTAVLETATGMDRYKDATLKGAESNANIPLTIEHKEFSTGENPMATQIAQSFGKEKGLAPETVSLECDAKAEKIAVETKKAVYNLPKGAEFKRHAGSTDVNFKDYFNVNIDIVYATLGIPPEVAMDKFGGAYSGSRAALKSWEYKIVVDRETMLKRRFYKPFYDYWLDIMVLDNMVQAPGYLQALTDNNFMVLEAYRNCRFIGATVPHIDPVKEVSAERLKLGKAFERVPLSSAEQSLEALNTGDYENVIKQAEKEIELAKEFEIDQSNNINE